MVADNVASLIAQKPVKWSSVSLAEVIGHGKRLEASVYDIEARQAKETVLSNRNGCIYFSDIIKEAYYPGRFKRIYCKHGYGVEFYLPSQMNDIYPKPEKYISALTKCDISELKLNENTLLLTRSGTIGNIAIVSKTTKGKVYSDDVIRVKFNDNAYVGYVYAYLKSNIGKTLLTTNGYGSVITHLEPEHLDIVPIPNAPEEIKNKINDLIVRSYDLRDKSNELLDKATAMLISELHLPPIEEFEKADFTKSQKVKTFTTRLCDLNRRLDASYHIPTVSAITKHLEKYAGDVTTIGNTMITAKIILPGRFKRIYVEEGYGITFFGGRSIGQLDPADKRYLSFSQHEKKIKDDLTIRENMILVTCSGTIGNVALVPAHWDGWAMTHDIIRLVAGRNIIGYLYIWLVTDYAKKYIEKTIYGSVVPHIEKEHVASVTVPLLKNKTAQTEINDMALRANDLRYQAYLLEQEALKALNDEVIYAK